MKIHGYNAFYALCAAAVLSMPAYAEIGAVGSPVVPSNVPQAKGHKRALMQQQPAALEEMTPESPLEGEVLNMRSAATPMDPTADAKPLMSINFNQRRVYYSNALQKAVKGAEQTKSGVSYYVVSYVPTGDTRVKNDRIKGETSANLRGVLNEMQYYGVPAANIITLTKEAPAGQPQKIEIFVQ